MSTNVTFDVDWDDEPGLRDRIPVDVLDARLTQVASGFIGQPLDLAEGVYAARAVLPDGRRVESAFQVPSGDDALPVKLAQTGQGASFVPPQDPPDSLGTRLRHLELGDVAQLGRTISRSVTERFGAEPPADAADETHSLSIRLFTGDGFERFSPVGPSRQRHLGETFEITATGSSALFLQVRPPLWRLTVPIRPLAAGEEADRIHVRMVLRGGTVFPHFVFANDDLELLVRYLGAGEFTTAGEIVDSQAMVAERAFNDEMQRPFSAAAGAYVLLRMPSLEPLSWTETFVHRFPWLPDARAIHGEWLARLGRHEEALVQFLTLPDVGVPIFSMGLSTALNRLTQYSSTDAIQRPDRFADVLQRLGDLAARTDFARPITTFKP